MINLFTFKIEYYLLALFLLCSLGGKCQFTVVSTFPTGSDQTDVFVVGNYAYLGDNNDLNILDISDITNPTSIAKLNVQGEIQEVFVEGNYAYIAALTSGFSIIDISDPYNPILVSSILSGVDANDVYVDGDKAYLANDDGLSIIDLIDPANPVIMSNLYYHPSVHSVDVQGSIVYAGVLWHGIKVIDASNLNSPYQIGSTSLNGNFTSGWAKDIQVHKDIVYFSSGHYGVYSFKLNSSMSLDSIGHSQIGYASELIVDNDYIYSADSDFRLYETDSSGYIAPPIHSFNPGTNNPRNVFVSNNYIFLGIRNYGLYILGLNSTTSDLENILQSASIATFPNPTSSATTMILNQSKETKVKLTDIQGKLVLEKTYHHVAEGQQETILLSDLPSGVYTLQVYEDNKLAVQKIVKH